MADDAAAKSADAPWQSSADKIREAAKWLMGTFGAAAALLIGTAPLAGIGKISGTEWLPVALGAGAALAAAGWAVFLASNVLLPEVTTLKEVQESNSLQDFRSKINDDANAFFGSWAESLVGFARKRKRELAAFRNLQVQVSRMDSLDEVTKRAVEAAKANAEVANSLTTQLVAIAGYEEVRQTFLGARRRLVWAAVVFVAGAALFLVSVQRAAGGTDEDVVAPRFARLALTTAGARQLRGQLGAQCDMSRVPALVLSGAGPWKVLTLARENCQSFQFDLEKDKGQPIFDLVPAGLVTASP